ncbi:MAG: transporter substrate-binding domain-containing protein [Thermodesulfobacteriota bacterium]
MGDREYGYAVRKEDGTLLRTLNEGLKRLMKSEHWDALTRGYMGR